MLVSSSCFCRLFVVVACVSTVLAQKELQNSTYAVPFTAGAAEYSVSVVTDAISVVCAATVAVTCQAIKIENSNQTTLGVPKTIDMYHAFYDIETTTTSNNTLLVCYTTGDDGSKCAELYIDYNFGLMGEPRNITKFCNANEACNGLALAKTTPSSIILCYGLNGASGACSLVEKQQNSIRSSRLVVFGDEPWAAISVVKVENGPVVLCAIIQQADVDSTGLCRLLNPTTLQPYGEKAQLDLGPSSTVSAAYVGRVSDRDRLTICYLSTATESLYCAAVFLLNDSFFVSSRTAFPAKYESLMALRLHPLSSDPTVLNAMACIATEEAGPTELVCSLVATSSLGVIQVDPNEMIVDQNGFYLQNVPLALSSTSDAGAYMESSMRLQSRSSSSSNVFISDVTVLPDFLGIFPSAVTMSNARTGDASSSTIASVGCVNVGLHDMDETRFCIATASKLDRPAQPPPPFSPSNYCDVGKAWECEARKEQCAMVNTVCVSKYACSTQTTSTGCDSLIKQGGQCKFENGQCVPTYDWNPQTMCQTVSKSSFCNGSPGCIWAANACRAKPYCQLPNKAQCKKSPGCKWIAKRCGTSSSAI